MSKFIRNKNNVGIVNLEKVTNIHPIEGKYIYFTFDSLNEQERNEILWVLEDKGEFECVMESLSFYIDEF